MQGDVADSIFFITSGQANVFVSGDFKGYVSGGDVVGQASLLTNRKYRNATVRATTEMDLFVLKNKDYNQIIKWHPEFKTWIANQPLAWGSQKNDPGPPATSSPIRKASAKLNRDGEPSIDVASAAAGMVKERRGSTVGDLLRDNVRSLMALKKRTAK
jgi:CRP-like cAMP-binding protein